MVHRIAGGLCSILIGSALFAALPLRAQVSFTPLGDLPGGRFNSWAWAVSADGRVVVGNSASDNFSEAFRWTAETGMIGLGSLASGRFNSRALGVSADGTVVVGDSTWDTPPGMTGFGPQAFRWSAGERVVGLGTLPVASGGSSAVVASADGSVVVGFSGYGFGFQIAPIRVPDFECLDWLNVLIHQVPAVEMWNRASPPLCHRPRFGVSAARPQVPELR
jgi:probable HAF family extracellular repeat protein